MVVLLKYALVNKFIRSGSKRHMTQYGPLSCTDRAQAGFIVIHFHNPPTNASVEISLSVCISLWST